MKRFEISVFRKKCGFSYVSYVDTHLFLLLYLGAFAVTPIVYDHGRSHGPERAADQ